METIRRTAPPTAQERPGRCWERSSHRQLQQSSLPRSKPLSDCGKGIRNLDRTVRSQLDEHPDVEIFLSLPHSGTINAAQMLAEWGDVRPAYPTPDSVSALAGMSPVTRQSGKHQVVLFRWACNKWFRQALTIYAGNSRHSSEWANDVYRRARTRGCDHPHAVRILGRARVRVIWRCWINHTPLRPLPARRTPSNDELTRPDPPIERPFTRPVLTRPHHPPARHRSPRRG